MSLELEIGELRLTFSGLSSHQHRVAEISRRAIGVLEELLEHDMRELEAAGAARRLRRVTARPVRADVHSTSDDHLAHLVGRAMYEAFREQLRI